MQRADFSPPRARGMAIHTVLLILSALAAGVFAILTWRQPMGSRFILYILLAAVLFFLALLFAYRLYALRYAVYSLDTDQLTLSWGLRAEQISISDIEWVRPPTALAVPLPLPFLRLPGAILGVRRHRDLGPVEFLASEKKSLLLVATRKRVFVISPEDPASFMQNIQRALETGSLSPTLSQSVYISSTIGQAWRNAAVRYLWLAGLLVNIGLLVWVSLIGPQLKAIPFGFLPSGLPAAAVSGSMLILLPIASLFLFVVGWIAGFFFYRREDQHPLAVIIWISGVVSTLLFVAAVLVIVTTPL